MSQLIERDASAVADRDASAVADGSPDLEAVAEIPSEPAVTNPRALRYNEDSERTAEWPPELRWQEITSLSSWR
jgi:hypothetical protein